MDSEKETKQKETKKKRESHPRKRERKREIKIKPKTYRKKQVTNLIVIIPALQVADTLGWKIASTGECSSSSRELL